MFASSSLAAALVLLTQGSTPAQDPAALARDFAQGLATHPYFSRIALERVESHPPYLFLVQKAGGDEPARSTQIAARYAEILAPALELFEQELVAPLQLARRADQRLVVAVLASPGDLDNYERVMNATAHLEAQGFYDRMLNAAVLCENPFQRLRSAAQVSLWARHLFVHVCQAAWYAGEGNQPSEPESFRSWVMEGLACELARRDPEAKVAPSVEDVLAFLRDLADERRRWSHARTSEELCTVSDPGELEAFFQAHAPARPPPDDLVPIRQAFYRQSALFLHFLLEGEQRSHRAACLSFLRKAFEGQDDCASFRESFHPTSPSELDDAFVVWALRVHAATPGAEPLDPVAIQQALRRDAGSQPSARATSLAPAPAPVLTVPGLALDLSSIGADERLALALYELDRGRARAGIARLEALALEASDTATRERTERELRRARAWIELRDGFLRQRLEKGARIEFTYGGKKLKSRILALDGNELRLEKGTAPGLSSVEAIDPLELAQQIEPSGAASDWARLYPYVLRGDPRARKLLEDDGGEAGALLSDLREDYPARLRLGALQGRLGELATRKPPTTREEVRANLDDLAAWRRDAEGLALLAEKRVALQDHARALLARELEFLAPETLLHGKFEARKDDVVRLTYEFDDPQELEDFTRDPYPRSARKILGSESSSDIPFRVESGTLVAHGAASLRSLIDLAAPLTVRYTFEFQETPIPTPNRNFALGICDDGRDHFLLAIDCRHLQRYDRDGKDQGRSESVLPSTDKPYAMELRHDGTQATLLSDGKLQRSLAVGSRQSGAFFLCMVSDCLVRIEGVQIEGHLAPNAFERVKRAWIEREMARF